MKRLRLARSVRYPDGRIQLYIEWRDLWVGAFVKPGALYVVVLPTVVLRIGTRPEPAPAAEPTLTFTPEQHRIAVQAATDWALMYPIPAWCLAEGAAAERIAGNWGRIAAAHILAALAAAPEPGDGDPLDYAMHTVWLDSGKWRWTTSRMTTEAREAAVAAVLRYDRAMKRNDPDEELLDRSDLVWWD